MTLTGVGWHLSAAHRGRDDVLHGHTWEVVVWWITHEDAGGLQSMLRACLADLDHQTLPDELASGEDLAQHIGQTLQRENVFNQIHSVDVSRPSERIYARWIA